MRTLLIALLAVCALMLAHPAPASIHHGPAIADVTATPEPDQNHRAAL